MSIYLYYYIYLISLGGFFILFFFSILSFRNNESLEIKKDKHKNSGIICLIDSFIYLAIALYVNFRHRKELKEKNGYM
jgi:hypothetical protein